MSREACSSCRFLGDKRDSGNFYEGLGPKAIWSGKCHRYPPAWTPQDRRGPDNRPSPGWGRFPQVEAVWWCGEYQAETPPSNNTRKD